MDDFFVQLRKAPITRTILFWKNFDRIGIFFWIFLGAALMIFIALLFKVQILGLTGGFVWFIYLAIFVAYLWAKM